MFSIIKGINKEKHQYQVLLYLLLFVLAGFAFVNFKDAAAFQRFLGSVNPFFAMLTLAVLGIVAFTFLLTKTDFCIIRRGGFKISWKFLSLLILFAAVAIFTDLRITFPEDMNIQWPMAWLFYPLIAFLVEILFHLLPLTLLLWLFYSIPGNPIGDKITWLAIAIVALLEPIFQMIFMQDAPIWAVMLTGINLFFFNLTQLCVFKIYDFISMLIYRIIYYLIWHIGWGYIRLDLLF